MALVKAVTTAEASGSRWASRTEPGTAATIKSTAAREDLPFGMRRPDVKLPSENILLLMNFLLLAYIEHAIGSKTCRFRLLLDAREHSCA